MAQHSFHGLDPNFVPPFAHEMDLSLEQSMPGKLSLQLGYVGTRGMRLPVFLDAQPGRPDAARFGHLQRAGCQQQLSTKTV